MKAIGIRRCVTIVGDPDQSSKYFFNSSRHPLKTFFIVYGWRSAEVINLARMREGSIYNIQLNNTNRDLYRFSQYTTNLLGTELQVYGINPEVLPCHSRRRFIFGPLRSAKLTNTFVRRQIAYPEVTPYFSPTGRNTRAS